MTTREAIAALIALGIHNQDPARIIADAVLDEVEQRTGSKTA